MKKLFYLLLFFSLAFGLSCSRDNRGNQNKSGVGSVGRSAQGGADTGGGLVQGVEVCFEEVRAQQQIAGWITAEEEFRRDDKFCALPDGFFIGGDEFLAVLLKRTNGRI